MWCYKKSNNMLKWIIQSDPSDDESDKKFEEALIKNGSNYQKYKYKAFSNLKDIEKDLGEIKEPVMFHGAIPFISKVQRINSYIPGSFCNFRGLECRSYYPILGNLMLNSDYIIVPWKKLLEDNFFGVKFIRPNSGKKVFNGTITEPIHLTQDVGLSIANIDPQTLVFVTSTKLIEFEWRFFVSNNKVITSSLYHIDGELVIEKRYDNNAYKLALEVSNLYNPDPIYVVDICKTYDGEYKVMELNGFSCSGLYACDVNEIVKFTEKYFKGKD